jgi:hypothetical protein
MLLNKGNIVGRYNSDTGLFSAKEFRNRGVIKLAPDALVYLNMSDNPVYISPIKGIAQNSELQDGIVSINIQNNVDPPGSSTCAIEIATPIYAENSYYWVKVKDTTTGQISLKPRFTAMMEVKVWFKGRFLVGKTPQYYPAFWGFVTSVEESFSGGMYKIQLQCGDMLHMWQFIQIAYRPSVESDVSVQGKQGIYIWGSRYAKDNPFQIIYSLCQQMGFENFITPGWLGALNTNGGAAYPDPRYMTIFQEAYMYWNKRFSGQFGNQLLKMYGASGQLINDPRYPAAPASQVNPSTDLTNQTSVNPGIAAVKNSSSPMFDIDKKLAEYEIFNVWADMKPLSEAEYKTKLEIATDIKTKIEFEFFQDVDGNFIFKPPFYNMNTKSLAPYNIKPQDIINFTASINSDEIVTALEVNISVIDQVRQNTWIPKKGFYMDMFLTKNYGFRYKQMDSWYISESKVARSYACGELGMMNAKAFTGSVTIPGRPELRLGYPVYIEHKDCFYYVKSINHTFDFGGTFTTTLSLEAKREKVFDNMGQKVLKDYVYKYVEPKDTNSPQGKYLQQEKAYFGELKNIQKDQALQNKYNKEAEAASKKTKSNVTIQPQTAPKHVYNNDSIIAMQQLIDDSGINSSMRDGVYEIVPMVDSNGQPDPSQMSISNTTIPYSDDEGYRVIGAFRYGRGLKVAPGSVLDDEENPYTAKADRVAQTVASMTPAASDSEGNIMSAYFKANTQAGIEAAIPSYLTLPIPVVQQQTTNTAATMMVNSSSGESKVSPKLSSSVTTITTAGK